MSAWGLAIFVHTPTMCAAPRKSQRTHARTQHPLNDIPAQRQQQTKTDRRPTETIVEIEVCVQRAFVPERRELDIFIGCFLFPPGALQDARRLNLQWRQKLLECFGVAS
uniref:Putative secreted protein n=1 Tax=Anopheles marajoara TaxID=58244 RepID=A0A2M4C7W8_9DIPT